MERVPALGEPSLADPAALQHAVREAGFGQRMADTEPCPASPDDNGFDLLLDHGGGSHGADVQPRYAVQCKDEMLIKTCFRR